MVHDGGCVCSVLPPFQHAYIATVPASQPVHSYLAIATAAQKQNACMVVNNAAERCDALLLKKPLVMYLKIIYITKNAGKCLERANVTSPHSIYVCMSVFSVVVARMAGCWQDFKYAYYRYIMLSSSCKPLTIILATYTITGATSDRQYHSITHTTTQEHNKYTRV